MSIPGEIPFGFPFFGLENLIPLVISMNAQNLYQIRCVFLLFDLVTKLNFWFSYSFWARSRGTREYSRAEGGGRGGEAEERYKSGEGGGSKAYSTVQYCSAVLHTVQY